MAEADTLLERLEGWAKRIEAVIERVENDGEYSEFWKGVSVLRPYLETIGELTKELERRPQVVLIAPYVQQTIIRALEPYADAKLAVAHALAEIEEAAS